MLYKPQIQSTTAQVHLFPSYNFSIKKREKSFCRHHNGDYYDYFCIVRCVKKIYTVLYNILYLSWSKEKKLLYYNLREIYILKLKLNMKNT